MSLICSYSCIPPIFSIFFFLVCSILLLLYVALDKGFFFFFFVSFLLWIHWGSWYKDLYHSSVMYNYQPLPHSLSFLFLELCLNVCYSFSLSPPCLLAYFNSLSIIANVYQEGFLWIFTSLYWQAMEFQYIFWKCPPIFWK